MQRVLRLGCLTLVVVGLCSRPVEAGLADWMEELSGPGPFHVDGFANFMWTFCLTPDLVQSYNAADQKPCLFADYRRLINNESDNFYQTIGEVRVTVSDFGVTFRPLAKIKPDWARIPLDVGAGGGFMRFRTSQDKVTTRGTVVLPRVVTSPILLFGTQEFWNNHRLARNWAGVLKLYANYHVIVGRLQGEEDFGAKGSTFDVNNDVVGSWGFLLDFVELIR